MRAGGGAQGAQRPRGTGAPAPGRRASTRVPPARRRWEGTGRCDPLRHPPRPALPATPHTRHRASAVDSHQHGHPYARGGLRSSMGALDGKAAIITGAATGIGQATAMLFARAGARLTLADLRKDELEKTVAALRAVGGEASAAVGDLARPEDCEKVVADALAAAGRLDVVFNNAGVGTMVVGGTVETIALDK